MSEFKNTNAQSCNHKNASSTSLHMSYQLKVYNDTTEGSKYNTKASVYAKKKAEGPAKKMSFSEQVHVHEKPY